MMTAKKTQPTRAEAVRGKRRRQRIAGSSQLMREFASGKWVPMLAEKYGTTEAEIEARLMDGTRKLLGREVKA